MDLLTLTICIYATVATATSDDNVHTRYERLQSQWSTPAQQSAKQFEAQGDSTAASAIRKALDTNTKKGSISIRLLNAPPASESTQSSPAPSESPGESSWQIAFA